MRTTSTLAALRRGGGRRARRRESAADRLREAWRLASRLRSAITLLTGQTSDVLPDRPAQLDGIGAAARSTRPRSATAARGGLPRHDAPGAPGVRAAVLRLVDPASRRRRERRPERRTTEASPGPRTRSRSSGAMTAEPRSARRRTRDCQTPKYSSYSNGCGRCASGLISFSLLYSIQVSISSGVNTPPASRNSWSAARAPRASRAASSAPAGCSWPPRGEARTGPCRRARAARCGS